MATIREQLATSLDRLRQVAQDGIVRSSELSRGDRERLQKHGFLEEVIKGWLIVTKPEVPMGSTISWYVSFWPFIRRYLNDRFGNDYCLSPEASLKLHTGSTVIPQQLVVITRKKGVQRIELPHGTSLLLYEDSERFPENRVHQENIWIMDLQSALCRVQPVFFRNYPFDVELALRMVKDLSALIKILVQGGHSAIAGRLAGAYRALNENEMAERIIKDMEITGCNVRETNPFDHFTPSLVAGTRVISPYVSRIEVMWRSMREQVPEIFPEAPGVPGNPDDYLRRVDEIYVNDAYNSLSIEGYRVTPELIEKIRSGEWDPDNSASDRQQRDAMAAKGYNLAFQSVKESIRKILMGGSPVEVISIDHQEWFKQMFLPSVQAGFLRVEDLIGYRNAPVYIQDSQHVPPSASAVVDCMGTLFELLKGEVHAGIRAVLGHFIFVFIHPYMDGNGRIGRFLMNTLLASGGYPWTVIRLERRTQYMSALEAASVHGDIKPFAKFIKDEMNLI
jgi:hypothetical protein